MRRLNRPATSRARTLLGAAALSGALLLAPGCASLKVDRDTQTTGTFVSKGWSFTILSIDLPQSALDIARENASDTRLANLVVEEARVYPNLGPLDWLLDIVGVRRAVVRGRWGYGD